MKFTKDENRECWREQFPSGWFWCLRCARAFNLERHQEEHKPGEKCECGTSVMLDGFDWNCLRRENPRKPKIPEHGICYMDVQIPLFKFV